MIEIAMSSNVEQNANYLRDAVFAASDGLITTFAVVAGSEGASLGNTVVLVLGFANLFADGISMAAGNYLGTKSEVEYEQAQGKRINHSSPRSQAFITFVAFNIAGLFPLVPYVVGMRNSFTASIVIVALIMFAVGAVRSKFTQKNMIRSGLEVFMVGGVAAIVAYITGEVLDRYVV